MTPPRTRLIRELQLRQAELATDRLRRTSAVDEMLQRVCAVRDSAADLHGRRKRQRGRKRRRDPCLASNSAGPTVSDLRLDVAARFRLWECRCNQRLRRFAVSRPVRALLLAALTFCLVAPSASAAPTRPLGATLGDLWTTVLETPTAENPFFTGDPACIDLR